MAGEVGVVRGLPLPRRWIAELMQISRGIPIITFERRICLEALARPRARAGVSWSMVFAKAFGEVCSRIAPLRSLYMPWPWPHLYECADVVMSFAVQRRYNGDPAVFFGRLRNPQRESLRGLQSTLDRWREAPVESVPEFRRLIRHARSVWFVRRIMWWYGMHAAGSIRVHNFGTCGMSITAGTGATATNIIAPVTATLNYGPFTREHEIDVRLHFDHRVLDGMTAALALAELESVLLGPLVQELNTMAEHPQSERSLSRH